MTERTIFIIYTVLLLAGFAPFLNLFSNTPILTVGWILGDLLALSILTVTVCLSRNFSDLDKNSGD